jgi:hypothetical protein
MNQFYQAIKHLTDEQAANLDDLKIAPASNVSIVH